MAVKFLEDDEVVKRIPRRKDFELIESRLSPSEFNSIIETLDRQIDGKEIHTSGWMPGSDWTGTPYQVLHEKAGYFDQGLAGKMFGLMVFMRSCNVPKSGSRDALKRMVNPSVAEPIFYLGSQENRSPVRMNLRAGSADQKFRLMMVM
jgi:hypothetical protein